jgi:predicted DNA binding CopG/RHH family protein
MTNKFQKWTEEDSKFALKQRLMGKKFSTIANKLGRTEAAVRIRISSMKIEARAKTVAVGPAVTKSYADKLVKKNRVKPKKKVAAKKAVVAPAESVLVNGGLMLTLSVSLAGGILGAALYNYFL